MLFENIEIKMLFENIEINCFYILFKWGEIILVQGKMNHEQTIMR